MFYPRSTHNYIQYLYICKYIYIYMSKFNHSKRQLPQQHEKNTCYKPIILGCPPFGVSRSAEPQAQEVSHALPHLAVKPAMHKAGHNSTLEAREASWATPGFWQAIEKHVLFSPLKNKKSLQVNVSNLSFALSFRVYDLHMSHEEKNSHFPIYCLFHRDPYNGLL